MKLTPQDWRKLQYPLIALVLVITVVASMVWFAHKQMTIAEQALRQQKSQLDQAHAKYQASGIEKQTIIETLPQYQQLINRGFVGEERRIEWVEALRNTHQHFKLFSIDYQIGQQQDYKPSFLPHLGAFTLHRSVMKLNFPMLHEGDILSLFDGLNSYQATPFIMRDCIMTRINKTLTYKTLTANLQTKCEVDWLTLREPTLALAAP